MAGPVSEALFIQLGMTKDKWPHVTVELVQGYLDDPSLLDGEESCPAFVESFFHYHGWYWRK